MKKRDLDQFKYQIGTGISVEYEIVQTDPVLGPSVVCSDECSFLDTDHDQCLLFKEVLTRIWAGSLCCSVCSTCMRVIKKTKGPIEYQIEQSHKKKDEEDRRAKEAQKQYMSGR